MRAILLVSTISILIPGIGRASVDRDLLALTPANVRSVASLDVARAQGSPFGQFMLSRMHDDAKFAEFIDRTGFDPRRDLQHIMVCSFGPGGPRSNVTVLARGIFDVDRLQSAAVAKGAKIQRYGAWSLIVHRSNPDNSTALVFPQADIAVFGDLNTVRSILDNSTSPQALDSDLQREIAAAGNKNDAWFASVAGGADLAFALPPSRDGNGKFSAQAKTLESIRRASGGVRFGDAVQVSLEAIARSPEDATSLADVVRFGASFVQMQRSKDPKAAILATALDKMALASTGDRVNLSFSIPEQDMEQLATPNAKVVALDSGRAGR